MESESAQGRKEILALREQVHPLKAGVTELKRRAS